MRRAVLVLLFAGFVSLTAFGASPQAAKGPSQDQWRYVLFNGEWWYWLPESRWVYWRNGRWNDFVPPAAGADRASAAVARGRVGPATADPGTTQSEIRPFYGHAGSAIDYGPSREEDIGPFYGHALPRDVFGSGAVPRFRRGPDYGRAGSSYMY